MIPLALLAVYIGIKAFPGSAGSSRQSTPQADSARLSAQEVKALGVEGDSPRDTVATLIAQVKQLRGELKSALDSNSEQKNENERLRARESAIDQRIQSAIDTEHERERREREQDSGAQQQTQALLQEVQHRLDRLSQKEGSQADLPIGLGLEDSPADGAGGDAVHWVEPQGTPLKKDNAPATRADPSESPEHAPTTIGSLPETSGGGHPEAEPTASEKSGSRPVYTIPANATLIGSTALTALIGRVPIDGTVNDPYPFKVLIGPENLTANGIVLPEVTGAVVSGTASGDWTLSCVRGHIRSVTFVFNDGTIRTLNSSATAGDALDGFHGGLGWISDPYGIPCVSGVRRSNAEQYLGSEMLITAAGAGAASLIKSNNANFSYIGSTNGNSLGTVGISGNEAMGRILAGGVEAMSQWVNKLYGQAFAAIYVPPGAPVAVHLEQPLEIDFDSNGRKVAYHTGVAHAPDLD
jgi:integrating conjugative element protein (TIGR03752 family)